MIRMDAIQQAEIKPKRFGPFTSMVSASALLGLCIGMASLLFKV